MEQFFYLSSDKEDRTNRFFFQIDFIIPGNIYLFKVNNRNTRAIQFGQKKFKENLKKTNLNLKNVKFKK